MMAPVARGSKAERALPEAVPRERLEAVHRGRRARLVRALPVPIGIRVVPRCRPPHHDRSAIRLPPRLRAAQRDTPVIPTWSTPLDAVVESLLLGRPACARGPVSRVTSAVKGRPVVLLDTCA